MFAFIALVLIVASFILGAYGRRTTARDNWSAGLFLVALATLLIGSFAWLF